MTIPSTFLDPLVGTTTRQATCWKDKDGVTQELPCEDVPAKFAHTDERMAFAISAEHPHSKKKKPGDLADGQMNRGQIVSLEMLYGTNERGVNHPQYDGSPGSRWTPKAGDRLLMGQLSSGSRFQRLFIERSMAGPAMKKMTCSLPDRVEGEAPPDPGAYTLIETEEGANACYFDGCEDLTEFPPFDLYVTDPECGCTYQIACADDMDTAHMMVTGGQMRFAIPNTGAKCWLIWAVPSADVPLNSYLSIDGWVIAK